MKIFNATRNWFIFICAINFIIYIPSFFHLPRADHFWYLLDTAKTDDLFSLIKNFYSYNRVRLHAPGDTLLFRPVVFIFLGIEKWLFGNNFIYPQIVGVILHLVLIWCLLKLLSLINPSRVVLICVAFFSTLSIIMDMVVWHHINAYILFMILILIALYHLILYGSEDTPKKYHLVIMAICLLIACFNYEAGIGYTFLFFIYLCLVRKKNIDFHFQWKYLLILLPIVLYVALDVLDYLHSNLYLSQSSSISQLSWHQLNKYLIAQINFSNFNRIMKLTFEICSKWLQFGLLPTIFRMYPGARFGIHSEIYEHNIINLKPDMIINIIAVVLLIVCLINGISIKRIRHGWKFTFLFILMFLIFLEIIVVGRGMARGVENIFEMCSYYSYFAWIYFVIIISSVLDFEKLKECVRPCGKWLLLISIIILICLNSYIVYSVNLTWAEKIKEIRLFVNRTNGFVKIHHDEPDFSFKMYRHPPESDILFIKYINKANPKYIISFE